MSENVKGKKNPAIPKDETPKKEKEKKKRGLENYEIDKVLAKNKRSIRNRRIVATVLVILLVFTFIVFGALLILEKNLLTISVAKTGTGKNAIMLCESEDFGDPLFSLAAGGDTMLDHYTYAWLPSDIGDQKGGSHGKYEAYVAYTFFLKNTSNAEVDYNIRVTTRNVTKGIDEAVRIMVILNGERTVYAKANRETGEPEWVTGPLDIDKEKYGHTTPFVGIGLAADTMRTGMEADSVDKFTIVIWLEGEDPDCINAVLDGKMKVAVKFTVIDDYVPPEKE